ncbi:MAG: MerR family transcriptional regulator [Telluria sp.]
MSIADKDPAFMTISEVERDIGVAKETLRVWERRYAFPQPSRDGNGERIYPVAQVERLRRIKRLIDQGFRPGKIIGLPDVQLMELGGKPAAGRAADADDPEINACLELLRAHKVPDLRQRLAQSLLRLGLRSFVVELVAPLTTAVGDSWSAGTIAVFEEHLFAEVLQNVMRTAIDAATGPAVQRAAAPRIVLTTVPQERHGLGLMMAEALFALEGAHCIPLGVQTPLAEIVAAAKSQHADIVALSFSSHVTTRAAVDNITELRSRLEGCAEVWAGGACANQARRQLGPGCVVDLDDIPATVARWRSEHTAVAVQA